MAAEGETGYGLDSAWQMARTRLRSLADWLDPGTIRRLHARGVGVRLWPGAAAWGNRAVTS